MSGKTGFNEDQIAEFQETFMLFDTRGDGMIPVRNKTENLIILQQKLHLTIEKNSLSLCSLENIIFDLILVKYKITKKIK